MPNGPSSPGRRLPLKSYQNGGGGSSATAPGSPLDSVKAPVALTSVQGHALKSDSGGTMVRRVFEFNRAVRSAKRCPFRVYTIPWHTIRITESNDLLGR